jgi:hypothetical protein
MKMLGAIPTLVVGMWAWHPFYVIIARSPGEGKELARLFRLFAAGGLCGRYETRRFPAREGPANVSL